MKHIEKYSILPAFTYGITQTWQQIQATLSFIKKVIFFDISFKNVGGVLTIAEVAGITVEQGWSKYIAFLAVLSISLGVLNLLPIPVLDGGHLLLFAVEAIKRKSYFITKTMVCLCLWFLDHRVVNGGSTL